MGRRHQQADSQSEERMGRKGKVVWETTKAVEEKRTTKEMYEVREPSETSR